MVIESFFSTFLFILNKNCIHKMSRSDFDVNDVSTKIPYLQDTRWSTKTSIDRFMVSYQKEYHIWIVYSFGWRVWLSSGERNRLTYLIHQTNFFFRNNLNYWFLRYMNEIMKHNIGTKWMCNAIFNFIQRKICHRDSLRKEATIVNGFLILITVEKVTGMKYEENSSRIFTCFYFFFLLYEYNTVDSGAFRSFRLWQKNVQ